MLKEGIDLHRNSPESRTGTFPSECGCYSPRTFYLTCEDTNNIFVIKLFALFCSFHLFGTKKCGDHLPQQCPVYLLMSTGWYIFWFMASWPHIEEELWGWCSPKETVVVE